MGQGDDEARGRAVLTGLAAMAAVAVVVGLVVGAVALGAVRMTGVGTSTGAGPTEEASLFIPPYQPTSSSPQTATARRSGSAADAASGTGSERGAERPRRKARQERRQRPPITLVASPLRVAPGERINLNGAYLNGEGVTLRVQRREAGTWTDFPVTATVTAGGFDTWIETSRSGRSPFRMLDPTTGRTSNTVVVTVG